MAFRQSCCYRCGETIANPELDPKCTNSLCGHCVVDPPPFDLSMFPFAYTEHAAKLIQKFKYDKKLILSDFLADAMITRLIQGKLDINLPSLIIPIPLHTKRLKLRGFNQSHELAKIIGKRLGLPVLAHYLIRHHENSIQTGLNKKQREKNIKGVFKLNPISRQALDKLQSANTALAQYNVILIDDVITTGATVREAARCLRKKHHGKIVCLAATKTQRSLSQTKPPRPSLEPSNRR